MRLFVNGASFAIQENWEEEKLVHVLRDHLGLSGTKFGCGQGQCGACTVLVDGEATRSCQLTPKDVVKQPIETIEGQSAADGSLSTLQRTWLAFSVPQCGYCQTGQIMAATALLRRRPRPLDDEIDAAMAGNICRCGTQMRIRDAIRAAARAQS